MPAPEALGPLGAHLASDEGSALRGQILFAGGSEVALVRPPRLLETVRTPDPAHVLRVLDAVIDSWVAAEAKQATTGGANPRYGGLYGEPADGATPVSLDAAGRRVLVVGDGGLAQLAGRQLENRGARVVVGPPPNGVLHDMRSLLTDTVERLGGIDAVILDTVKAGAPDFGGTWASILADHAGLADRIGMDARWARAAAKHSAATGQPIRMVALIDAAGPAGRSRAQAAAQLARAGAGATAGRVTALVVSVEDREQRPAATALAALLAVDERAVGLAGAELAVGAGWMGLRSHPTPAGSLVFGGPDLPPWFDEALAEVAGLDGA